MIHWKLGRSFISLGSMILVAIVLPGCISFGGDSSDTRASKIAAENAIYREVAELVKLYRACLQKNEDTPAKAKENCGMYRDAIRDLAPDNMRTIVGEVLDRMRERPLRQSSRRDLEP